MRERHPTIRRPLADRGARLLRTALLAALLAPVGVAGSAGAQTDGGPPPAPADGAAAGARPDGAARTARPDGGGTTALTPDAPGAPPSPETPRSPHHGAPSGAADFTGLRGRVSDARTGEPLIEATVRVVQGGPPRQVLTDVDGKYRLELAPGTYELRVFYEAHRPRRLGQVTVPRGPARTLDIALGGDEKAVEEVVVEARADRRSEAALLKERQRSATVSDGISAQQIARSGDQNASDAVKRVVAATVKDGRYVLVRGLGGRYSQTLLNGVELPSPDPDEQAVPLDLFPAALLANLTLIKSYSPELPGAFSAGSLSIETNSYPRSPELRLTLGGEFNTQTTFRPFLGYPGSPTDFLGFDSGSRAIPAVVPRNQPLRPSASLSAREIESIGESFRDVWSAQRRSALPNLTFGATGGNSHLFASGARLGYLASLSYAHRYRTQISDITAVRLEGQDLVARERVTEQAGIETATLGALLATGLELDRDHELHLLSLYTRSTDVRSNLVTGFSEADNLALQATRLLFVARALSFTQLRGEHRFPSRGTELRWQANLSVTTRSEPDTRDTTYNVLDSGALRFRNQPGSGERFFSELTDYSGGGGLDFLLPVKQAKLKLGARVQYTARSFDARRFRFNFQGDDPTVLQQSAERLFSAQNIGPAFRLEERTLQSDSYQASLLVGGVYAMADWQLSQKLRLIFGTRFEAASQKLTPGSRFAITSTPEAGVDRTTADFMPALNAVHALGDRTNLRASYSYTLARPKFRELAPFLYFDFSRRRAISGNPALVETRIHNTDLRVEYFPRPGAVLAATFFHKYFDRPIEQVIFNVAEGDISFANARAAQSMGGELEARTTLQFLAPAGSPMPLLNELFVGANLSLIYSRAEIGDEQRGALTSASRPLQGQSPYVVNLTAGWSRERTGTDLAVLYNVHGPRISEVGFDRLPDVYEQPFHRLDVTLAQRLWRGLRLKLSGTNLANQAVTYRQGSLDVYRYLPGVTVLATLEWSLF